MLNPIGSNLPDGAPGAEVPADALSGVYVPGVPSDGLTLDTPAGPVDLVAVERITAGVRTPAGPAERAYVLDLILDGRAQLTRCAAGLRVSGATLLSLIAARRAGLGAAA